MTNLFASVNGRHITACKLYVPNVGPWFIDCVLDDSVALAGAVKVQLGSLALAGSVAPGSSGNYGPTRKLRVIAGGAGWGSPLPPRAYHNDAGVRALNVATDAAREAGETLGAFSLASTRLGVDYVRRGGPASVSLEDVAGGVAWWVGFDGATNVGPRPAKPLNPGGWDLLHFDPQSQIATFSVDDPATLEIGHVVADDRLATSKTIRELELTVENDSFRVIAWCGGDEFAHGRLEQLFTALVDRLLARKLFGRYRYRVVSMAPDGRVNLQAVVKLDELPDVLPVTEKPGAPGAWASLVLGSEVLVEFTAGNPAAPSVTGFPGRGENGFIPDRTTFGAATPPDAPDAARKGDQVDVLLPPAIFTGTIGGVPASGVLAFPTGRTVGQITTGSQKVGIG